MDCIGGQTWPSRKLNISYGLDDSEFGRAEETLMEVIDERFPGGNCVRIFGNLDRPSIIHHLVSTV